MDEFILSLKESFDKGDRAIRTKQTRYFEYHIVKARKDKAKKLMRELIAKRSKTPSIEFGSEDFKRLIYVRYADD
jgi:hypothetical protein